MGDPNSTSTQAVIGHPEILQRFETSLSRGRLGSAYLFVGPAGVGKGTFARWLAKCLLCESTPADQLACCGTCPACIQVVAETHPDLEIVLKPEERSTIPIELLIGDKNRRMRDGLCARIAMTPARGGRRIAIIDDADYLGIEAANCLLKTLEEPPSAALIILIGTSAQRQLPTIRSRCQLIRFRPLPPDALSRLIYEQGLAETEGQAEDLALRSQGNLQRAQLLAVPETEQFVQELCAELSQSWRPLRLVRLVMEFVEAGGKEHSQRRARMSLATALVADFYRAALLAWTGSDLQDSALPHARQVAANWAYDGDTLAAAIDRCLTANQHVGMNTNLATNLEAWLDELWGITQLGSRNPGNWASEA